MDLQLNIIGSIYNMYSYPLLFVCMKFREYIETHQAFTAEDVYAVATTATARTLLHRALKSGDIERARRGVYVSKTGKFRGEAPDPFLVATTADPDAVFSWHSALVAHGVAHNVGFECSFRSSAVRSSFEYGGIRYVPYNAGDAPLTQVMRARSYGAVAVTTREQTIADCLAHPGRAGGIEEVLRSCSAFPYIDADALVGLLEDAPAALCARAGWLLEAKKDDWGIDGGTLEILESRLGRGPSKLDPRSGENRGWSARWKLYLPEEESEASSWVS